MLTIHRYLLRQVLVVLVIALLVFVAVLLLGNAFKEVISLLVSRQVSLGTVMEILLLRCLGFYRSRCRSVSWLRFCSFSAA